MAEELGQAASDSGAVGGQGGAASSAGGSSSGTGGGSSSGGTAGGGAGGGLQRTASTSPATPSATSPGTSGSGEGGAAGNAAASGGTDWVSIREAAQRAGYADAAKFQDDGTFLTQLILQAQQARQAQELAQYGRQYLQHADQFQAYLRSQQEAAQRQQQQQQQPWWKAPEYDPTWRYKLTRDPQTGEIRPAPGADPEVVRKYMQAIEHRDQFLDKFAFNPIEAIKPGIEEVARAVAQQIVQEQLGGFRGQLQAQQIVQQASPWLYERDQQGNYVYGQDGRPQLSAAGRLYRTYAQQGYELGIRNDAQLHAYAEGLVQRDLALLKLQQLQAQQGGQQQQQQAAAAGDAAKAAFVERAAGSGGARHIPSSGGSETNGGGTQNGKGQPLAERMRAAFRAKGITDDQVNATLSGRR